MKQGGEYIDIAVKSILGQWGGISQNKVGCDMYG